jgi:hypothetical protein
VSVLPAVKTRDQCVVTKTGERGETSRRSVVPDKGVGVEVLNNFETNRSLGERKRQEF